MNDFYKGLLPNLQIKIEKSSSLWKFGAIINGKKIIDPLLHWSSFILGFDNEDFVNAVAKKIINKKAETGTSQQKIDSTAKIDRCSYELAERLFDISTGYRSIFSLSGSDANEGAVKLASAYHFTNGNLIRKKIVSFKPSYHGSTFLTSCMGYENSMLGSPFYTMEPFNDVIRLNRNFETSDCDWDQIFCIFVETCSYGNNLEPYSKNFWEKISYLQTEKDVIVILDDIFTGGGKTGSFIGWQNLPITPDIFTMGKSITAGHFPLSVTLYSNKIHNALGNNFVWNHGFTYSFTLPGAASSLHYLDLLEKYQYLHQYENLVSQAESVFLNNDFTIINRFGQYFWIRYNGSSMIWLIPLNADTEYFNVLNSNLELIKNIINSTHL